MTNGNEILMKTKIQHTSKRLRPGMKRMKSKLLKVLIAGDSYFPQVNGGTISTRQLVKGLAKRGHEVSLVVPNTTYRDEEEQDASNPKITIYRIKSLPTKPFHPEIRLVVGTGIDVKMERIFRRFKPDIVHIYDQFGVAKACLKQGRGFRIPVVGTNHFMPENFLFHLPKPLRPVNLLWKHFLRVYNFLDYVTVPSRTGMKILREAGLKTPLQVISNGIELKKYYRTRVSPQVYKKYGIRKGVPVFLVVGRLDKDKKTDMIIRATAVAVRSSKLQMVAVGKGKDSKQFKNLARRLGLDGVLVFTGYVPEEDLIKIYNLADVYVAPGLAELQGMAVMEAMATGLPILAADAVALPELVENGVNGFLFKPTVKDLAEKMLLMLANRNRWKQMGGKNVRKIQAHDIPVVLDQIERLYRQLIAANEGKRLLAHMPASDSKTTSNREDKKCTKTHFLK